MQIKRLFIALLFLLFVFYGCLDFSKVSYRGLPITIEYKKGTVRSGIDKEGNPWQQEMFHHYGYFTNILGEDCEELDVYYNPDSKSDKIFRITQLDVLTKEFDEYKIMLGFSNIEDAKQGYLVHYPDEWIGFGGIEEITFKELTNER